MRDLSRLLRPRHVAVIGGGAWCASVINQCRLIGFAGDIWPVHPKADAVGGLPAFKALEDLPKAPDAVFIGVNRHLTINIAGKLSAMGAGGAICFASGFRESVAEDAAGADLQAELLVAAGEMPILGPNCYGFINYLDNALLWPDQHGGVQVDRGVAVVMQSSNMAINITMQKRGLPLAYMVAAGNQAQTGISDIGAALLEDDRVTALGLHIEGLDDLAAFEALAAKARAKGKAIVALKVGRSEQAQSATISHTASLAGGMAGAEALFRRLGVISVDGLPEFLETLKLLHVTGRLPSNRIATISCSGGEASLSADLCVGRDLVLPPLNETQKTDLRAALGPMVALANPLDYHTYIWRDTKAMTSAFSAMMDPGLAMTLLIVDFPRDDRCDDGDWECAIAATIAAKERTGAAVGMVATLPELLPEAVSERLLAAGVVPFTGLNEAFAAIEAAAKPLGDAPLPLLLPAQDVEADLVPEAEAKRRLADHGLSVPRLVQVATPQDASTAAADIGFPLVLKGEGIAHKTEAGAVRLSLQNAAEVLDAACAMPAQSFLVEEMVTGAVAELLIGVVRDAAHGYVLTIGAGGTLTELLKDSQSLLVPASDAMISDALDRLRIAPLLAGYRGAPAANRDAIIAAVNAVQTYVMAHADGLDEVEINPLLCTPERAVAADALLRRKD